MKYGQLLLGVVLGAVGMHFLHAMGYMGKKKVESKDQPTEEKNNPEDAYSTPLRKKYDIVLKPNEYTKKVVQKAKDLTRGRYEVDLNKVKQPVSI